MYPMDSHSRLADSNVSNDDPTRISNEWQVQDPKRWQIFDWVLLDSSTTRIITQRSYRPTVSQNSMFFRTNTVDVLPDFWVLYCREDHRAKTAFHGVPAAEVRNGGRKRVCSETTGKTVARVIEHYKQDTAVDSKGVPTLFVRYAGGLGAL